MKTTFILFSTFVLLGFTSLAQHQKSVIDPSIGKSHQISIEPQQSGLLIQERSGEVFSEPPATSWNRKFISFEKRHGLPEDVLAEKRAKTALKRAELNPPYPDEQSMKGVTDNPIIGASFEGNTFDGTTPPDNSMAISNGGNIVSVTNSHIEYFDMSGTRTYTSSFEDFFQDPSFTALIYDPVVLYDSQADRFFMVVLHGSNSSLSKVIVCFSKSNKPSDGWHFYKLTGDPLGNSNWFDYPKIGVSTNEVYVTGNLFNNSDQFQQVVLYQITKADGYAGINLGWQYWYNIDSSPFTLVPASYGLQGAYGPGIYLVSTQRNNIGPDVYRLYDLTNDISGSPELKAYSVSADFTLAGDAPQLGTTVDLDNGDNRCLKAFYLEGIVHFVFHSEYTNNYNGLNYNRLTISNLSNWNAKFGSNGYDYSYPSLASFGSTKSDKQVMIGFLRVSSTIYPQIRVVYVNNAGEWSNSSLVKEGTTYVDVYESSGVARWGDYSGISKKYNATNPEVWMSGGFGSFQLGEHSFDTWIAQINGVAIGINDQANKESKPIKIYPNPVYDMMNVEFTLTSRSTIQIVVLDQQGKLVKLLLEDTVPMGKSSFSFNKGALAKGIYFIRVTSDKNTINYEKFIVQ